MLHKTPSPSIFALVSVLLVCLGQVTQADPAQPTRKSGQPTESSPRAAVEAVLKWLPADTESLFVAQSPFELRAEEPFDPAGKVAWSAWESNWHELVMWQFRSVNEGKLYEQALRNRVRLVVSAGRSYRAPQDLGLMRYDGCEVIWFDEASKSAASELMKAATSSALATEQIAGQTVAVSRLTRRLDEWTLLVCNPSPSVLIVATDRDFLQETLEGMRAPRKERALPASLGEWSYLDQKAECWAIRHFDHKRAKTSYLRGPDGDPAAIGIVCVWHDDGGSPAMKLVHLTEAKNNAKVVREAWTLVADQKRNRWTPPKVKQLAPGALQVTHHLTEGEAAAYALLRFLDVFGPGIYL